MVKLVEHSEVVGNCEIAARGGDFQEGVAVVTLVRSAIGIQSGFEAAVCRKQVHISRSVGAGTIAGHPDGRAVDAEEGGAVLTDSTVWRHIQDGGASEVCLLE